MTGKRSDYLLMQSRLLAVARYAAEMITVDALTDLQQRIAYSHAVGPILDPTLYRSGADAMTAIEKIAKAVLHLAATWEAHASKIPMTVRDALALVEVPSSPVD